MSAVGPGREIGGKRSVIDVPLSRPSLVSAERTCRAEIKHQLTAAPGERAAVGFVWFLMEILHGWPGPSLVSGFWEGRACCMLFACTVICLAKDRLRGCLLGSKLEVDLNWENILFACLCLERAVPSDGGTGRLLCASLL